MEWVWEVCAEDVDLGVMLQVISSQREHSSSIRALHALSRNNSRSHVACSAESIARGDAREVEANFPLVLSTSQQSQAQTVLLISQLS